jgi:hypothetical protein
MQEVVATGREGKTLREFLSQGPYFFFGPRNLFQGLNELEVVFEMGRVLFQLTLQKLDTKFNKLRVCLFVKIRNKTTHCLLHLCEVVTTARAATRTETRTGFHLHAQASDGPYKKKLLGVLFPNLVHIKPNPFLYNVGNFGVRQKGAHQFQIT